MKFGEIAMTEIINRRYMLQDTLGEGGMGVVYRAFDRLAGQEVALKSVKASTRELMFNSRTDDSGNLKLALAREFQTLASLRHPHIISVLDYGFDEQSQPFFTMELVEDARTIVEAGHNQSMEERLRLMEQLSQALLYLHRRGILHRDLKPANVVVVKQQVKVLDFGLAVISRTDNLQYETQSTAGTFAYMAPELFAGQAVTRAADLYAAGVMLYELLAGRHPFNVTNVALLIADILHKQVDVASLELDDSLAAIIERLLSKTAEERYEDAGQLLIELHSCMGIVAVENVDIRESFLQAAKFVGREVELATLVTAMHAAQEGKGNAVLVGGESGVGKSRLLDELRTRAMVDGARVLRGQAVSEKIGSYQIWRDVLRQLCILSDLTDQEAGLLLPLVPEISALLGREIPMPPPLDPPARQSRMSALIIDLFRRQTQPIVLILEDIQWAGDDSLALLKHLTEAVVDLRLLVIASYRSDEFPDLPAQLPRLTVIKLARFGENSILELSAAILGEVGRQPHLIERLKRETEGNAFFLVEVVRALAEAAGQLSSIGQTVLPESILTGGIQQIIETRLARLPDAARPLLQMAAVLGRELDLPVLKVVDAAIDLEQFLTDCAAVSVIEVQDNRWRFAHDKLREQLLHNLAETERANCHRRAALAIEGASPTRLQQPATLAYHWHMAGDSAKELQYTILAGRQAIKDCAYADSIGLLSRALELLALLPDSPTRSLQELELQIDLGTAWVVTTGSGGPNVYKTYARARVLAEQLGDTDHLFTSQWGLWYYHTLRAEHSTARNIGEDLLRLAKDSQNRDYLLQSHHCLWATKFWIGEISQVREHTKEGIALYDLHQHRSHILLYGAHDPCICGYTFAGMSSWLLGYPDQARQQCLAGFQLADTVGHPFSTSLGLALSALTFQFLQDGQALLELTERGIELSSKHGFVQWQAFSEIQQGWAKVALGQSEGIEQIRQGLEASDHALAKWGRSYYLSLLADAYAKLGHTSAAIEVLDEVQTVMVRTGEYLWEPEVFRLRAEVLLAQGESPKVAELLYQQAIALAQQRHARALELRAARGLAQLWQRQTKVAEAHSLLFSVYSAFSEGFSTADLQEAKTLLDELS
jgi:predicted ATPase